MPRILFPFTRAKLNSIARLAREKIKEKKSYNIYSGNETETQVCAEHQALADVLMSLHDPVIPAFAREINQHYQS